MRRYREFLLIITISLVSVGIVMVYSTTGVLAALKRGDSAFFLKKHVFHALLGIVVMLAVSRIDVDWLRRNSRRFLYVALAMLLLVFTPLGREAGNATRWISIMGARFQPVEFCKIALIVYLAGLIYRKKSAMSCLRRGFIPCMVIIAVVTLPVLLQPDFGTAVFIALLASVLLICAGLRLKYWATSMLACLPLLYFMILSAPYRWARIKAFMDPWANPRKEGFQIIQSFIALGSGGMTGVGLGHSKQKLFFLPEAHTDFICAIIGEEFGLAGLLIIMLLFCAFIYYGWRIASEARDDFSFFTAFGITLMIGMEALINMAVVTGSMPTKGLPLPFVSYGGSSLLMHLAAVGLLFAVSRHIENEKARRGE